MITDMNYPYVSFETPDITVRMHARISELSQLTVTIEARMGKPSHQLH